MAGAVPEREGSGGKAVKGCCVTVSPRGRVGRGGACVGTIGSVAPEGNAGRFRGTGGGPLGGREGFRAGREGGAELCVAAEIGGELLFALELLVDCEVGPAPDRLGGGGGGPLTGVSSALEGGAGEGLLAMEGTAVLASSWAEESRVN